ncbi:MAG TPA: glycoside hydrolase family 18 protein [Bacteroidota bacterium]|nr:glycoside hydrolase family 18 protein [Bacteroidota bacterium]
MTRLHCLFHAKRRAAWLLAIALLFIQGISAQNRPWITVYYPHWWYAEVNPVSAIDYTKFSHLVIFSANPDYKAPYLDVLVNPKDSEQVEYGVLTGRPAPYLQQTVTNAHRHGVKVLLSVGGIAGDGATTMSWIAKDPARIDIFVRAACAYARRKSLDGIELDWEFPGTADRAGHNRLINAFRRELDSWPVRGTFIAAVHQAPWAMFGYDRDSLVACFDQINLMTYEMYAGDFSRMQTGYNSPIERPTGFGDYAGYAIDQNNCGPGAWIAKGYPASKLGLGISFTTVEFSGVQAPVQPCRPYGAHNWGYVKNIPAEGRHWDSDGLVPWQASGSKMISYEDTASCRYKAEFALRKGLGGVMIYELGSGYLPEAPNGEKDQLLGATRDALWGHSTKNVKNRK